MGAMIGADILVVEPDADEGLRIASQLERIRPDLRTFVCRDGLEAIEFVFRTGRHWRRPDGRLRLILLDEDAPVLDGREVVRRMNTSNATKGTRVIFLSGATPDTDEGGLPRGVIARQQKPVTAEGLAAGLRAAEKPQPRKGRPT